MTSATGSPRVAIIGAGMSGICAAIKLDDAGFHDYTIYEKASEVGGTWRENTYPGLSCDVPSRFYSYSFAPNPDWSTNFSPGAEIWDYFRRVADRHGVRRHIRFGDEVVAARWDEGCWQLRTASGHEAQAEVLIAACGVLHHPRMPQIEGLESFGGASFHSARWDHSVPLDGRRVGVIGTGSTGVQITCALAPRVDRFALFQRTPQWILPAPQHAYSAVTRRAFNRWPRLNELSYQAYMRLFEITFGTAVVRSGWQRTAVDRLCRLNLRTVRDPDLRRRLTPDYDPMCKRLVISGSFYGAVQRPNVDVVTDPIERVTERGVLTRDGRLHDLDVLVLATGFDAHAYLRPMEVLGAEGRTLDEAWAPEPHGYMTIAVPGFPNFFTMLGPHSPFGNQSLVAVAETQMDYVVSWLRVLREGHVTAVAPTARATERFNAQVRDAMRDTVWTTGCASWYLGADGLPMNWPWTPDRYREMLRTPALEDFELSVPSIA